MQQRLWRPRRRPSALIFAFFLVLGCIGCGKPVFHIVARGKYSDEGERYKIFLKGRELGTITGSGTLEFDAEGQRGDTEKMLPKDIEARIPGECGWMKTDFDLHPTVGSDEMERARSQHRPIPATMEISYSGGPDFNWVTIFVDNRGGPPQTVSIGGLQELVPAGATRRLLFAHTGGCDEAKDVRLNGEALAPVDIHRTLLIDVKRSHCYRKDYAGYGVNLSGHGKTIYRPGFFQYFDDNPDFFMEPPPGYQLDQKVLTILNDVTCPKR
ncbi:MAG TPA: hypothetical protein VI685_04990 [Candidatus Angelobacter sp.]